MTAPDRSIPTERTNERLNERPIDHKVRVLLVEDERSIRDPLADYLTEHGYVVSTAADAADARTLVNAIAFDIAVCDIMMPGEDGLSFTRHLRETTDVPVILLTARAEETERIIGLEIGADDYVTKPFSPRELVARIKVVLRRASRGRGSKPDGGSSYAFDRWILKPGERALLGRDGVTVPLSSGEFELLSVFVRHPRQVMSRDRLMELTGGDDSDSFDRAIDNRVSRLRRKIEDDARAPAIIKTVWGGGYSFAAAVTTVKPEGDGR